MNTLKILITFFLLLTIFILLETNSPYFFLRGDNPAYFLPSYVYNWRAFIEHHTIPLINFHQYLGQTYLGQAQNGVFYPPAYLSVGLSYLFFSHPYAAIDIIVITHLIGAVFTMYLLLRYWKIDRGVSLLGGVLWISFPLISILSRSAVIITYFAFFAPLIFLLLEKFLAKPQFKTAFWLAFVKMWFFYQGYIQYELILFQFELLYVLIRFYQRRANKPLLKSTVGYYSLSLLMLLFMVAPLLLPLWHTQQVSFDRSKPLTIDYFLIGALDLEPLLKTQILNFQDDQKYWYGIHYYYIGAFAMAILPLLFMPNIRRRLRHKYFLLFLFLGLLALILTTPLYLIVYPVPFLNLFRYPYKYFYFFLFFTALTVMGICDSLVRRRSLSGKFAIWFLLSLMVVINILVSALPPSKPLPIIPLASRPNNWDFLNNKSYRITNFGVSPSTDYPVPYLVLNYPTLFNYYHLSGFDPLISARNLQLSWYWPDTYHGVPEDAIRFQQHHLNHLSKWGVRYFLTPNNNEVKQALQDFPQMQPIHEEDGLLVYDNRSALPLVHESKSQQETPHEFGINQVDIYPQNPFPHEITISLVNLPGYRYSINGLKQGPVPAGNDNMKIKLPPDTRHLRVYYVDQYFNTGLALFIIFWCVLGSWYFHRLRHIFLGQQKTMPKKIPGKFP